MGLVKVLGVLASLMFVNVAQAEVKYEIRDLSVLSYSGGTLEVGYRTGGGCAKHEVRIELELVSKYTPNSNQYDPSNFKVRIFDVTPNGDMCEAIIGVEGKFDLKPLIKAEAQKHGLIEQEVTVELPKVSLTVM